MRRMRAPPEPKISDVIHLFQVTNELPDGARLADFICRDVSLPDVRQGALHVLACGWVEIVAVEVFAQHLVGGVELLKDVAAHACFSESG
ncbi:MAG: hypothetical protein L0Z50_16600 [Verrucomicrobiales bacterium]|nr:hypothetical protein [Verrucomicrobiales bacterium]